MNEIRKNNDGEWFSSWFNADYLSVYPHRDETEAKEFLNRWDIWQQLPKGALCLDLACGEGRYTRALSSRNIKVIGLDLSEFLLQTAYGRSRKNLNLPQFVRGDMRHIPFNGCFSLVTCMFTSFGYFETEEAHSSVLSEVYNSLLPNGKFVLDLPAFKKTFEFVKNNPLTIKDDNNIYIKEVRSYFEESKRIVKKIYIEDGISKREFIESVRLFTLEEITQMLTETGFKLDKVWGSYYGNAMADNSPRMILFCTKLNS